MLADLIGHHPGQSRTLRAARASGFLGEDAAAGVVSSGGSGSNESTGGLRASSSPHPPQSLAVAA